MEHISAPIARVLAGVIDKMAEASGDTSPEFSPSRGRTSPFSPPPPPRETPASTGPRHD
ncbi:hypothetical protein HMPREF9946_02137 [Acetobacteraceae bacterium AT-5844]|nr:hypothetical protein HMPREF9946_02137 [Acetobacteraceae bacterium AT-5844]